MSSAKESIRARRQRLASVPRACEACKIRKIRCDRSHPCSNCQAAGIACEQAPSVSDNRPQTTDRIAQLQDKFKRLEHRLSEVENQHKGTVTITNSTESQSQLSSSPSTHLYQGSSSFATLSAEASKAVHLSTLVTTNSIGDSVRELGNLINTGRTVSSSDDHFLSPVSVERPVTGLESIPVDLVISVIRKIKEHGSVFLHGYVVSDITFIENICRRVYFPTDPVSTGLTTAMYGLLHFLLKEISILGEPLGTEYDLKTYVTHCKRNFNAGIETYNILVIPSFENILSLTLGVIMAQNEAKPFLACTLASAAASHCRILGYHREKTYQSNHDEVTQTKRRLFWSLYVFDKNISLLLGRSSSFQDFDIDVQHPPLSADIGHKPWDQWFHMAIRLAKAQGQIYDRLYSPAGLQMEVAERGREIDNLELALRRWRTDLEQIDGTHANYPQIFSLSQAHWDIMYYSTLTSLLRATATPSNGGEISSRCFQAARLSLQSHLRSFSAYKSSEVLLDADFANWVLHNSSFTPFIVIFLHSIPTRSVSDLDLLDEVVRTLEGTRQAGRSFQQLYELCATFARLTRHLVEAAQPCGGAYDPDADTLQLPEAADNMQEGWLEALQTLDGVPDGSSHEHDFDISAIFADWMNGRPLSQADPS
ncbi:hypothetical protein F5Y08DRAFT_326165 [Xylaria arbuscula]|nr:hypothetical protein F5Y08DRAFT_326165 [Xylaria arbuscula]